MKNSASVVGQPRWRLAKILPVWSSNYAGDLRKFSQRGWTTTLETHNFFCQRSRTTTLETCGKFCQCGCPTTLETCGNLASVVGQPHWRPAEILPAWSFNHTGNVFRGSPVWSSNHAGRISSKSPAWLPNHTGKLFHGPPAWLDNDAGKKIPQVSSVVARPCGDLQKILPA
jgi:hypothetical protein